MNTLNDCRLLAVMLIVVTAGGVAQAQIVIPDGWYRGNTHTHSAANGGDSPAVEVVAHYRDIGYDFLVITEHNQVSDCAQYSQSGRRRDPRPGRAGERTPRGRGSARAQHRVHGDGRALP